MMLCVACLLPGSAAWLAQPANAATPVKIRISCRVPGLELLSPAASVVLPGLFVAVGVMLALFATVMFVFFR
jgi:hypothetical protein